MTSRAGSLECDCSNRGEMMTRNQKAMLAILALAVIAVFALGVVLSFNQYLTTEGDAFQQTMDAIDTQTRATFTAAASGG